MGNAISNNPKYQCNQILDGSDGGFICSLTYVGGNKIIYCKKSLTLYNCLKKNKIKIMKNQKTFARTWIWRIIKINNCLVITIAQNRITHIWNWKKNILIKIINSNSFYNTEIKQLDKNRVIFSTIEHNIAILDIIKGQVQLAIKQAHKFSIWSFQIHKNKNLLITTSEDKTISLWSLDNFIYKKSITCANEIYSSQLLGEDQFVVGNNIGIEIYDINSLQLIQQFNVSDQLIQKCNKFTQTRIMALQVVNQDLIMFTQENVQFILLYTTKRNQIIQQIPISEQFVYDIELNSPINNIIFACAKNTIFYLQL